VTRKFPGKVRGEHRGREVFFRRRGGGRRSDVGARSRRPEGERRREASRSGVRGVRWAVGVPACRQRRCAPEAGDPNYVCRVLSVRSGFGFLRFGRQNKADPGKSRRATQIRLSPATDFELLAKPLPSPNSGRGVGGEGQGFIPASNEVLLGSLIDVADKPRTMPFTGRINSRLQRREVRLRGLNPFVRSLSEVSISRW
jgi:hypothetical protein